MSTLELLFEEPGLPQTELPEALRDGYGGDLGFDRPRLVANFVSTIDGVVAIPGLAKSNKLIADGSESDRFVIGLLRAFADAVLIGSGTLRASARGVWTAERAFPDAADGFAELRRRLGQPPAPERVVVTGTGDLPTAHPVFEEGALVLTTDLGAERLEGRLPEASTVVSLGGTTSVDVRAVIAALRARDHQLLVSEAGPHVFASLLEAGLVDELFLTVSPLLAGRGASRRLGLVEGFEALPDERSRGRLLSARRDGAHLFLRYELSSRT